MVTSTPPKQKKTPHRDSKKAPQTSTGSNNAASAADPIDRMFVHRTLYQCFGLSKEPCYLFDPHSGNILHANKAAERFFHRIKGLAHNTKIDQLYPNNADALFVFTEEAIELGEAYTRQLECLSPDGKVIPIEHSAISCKSKDKTVIAVRLNNLEALKRRTIEDASHQYVREGLLTWLRDEQYFRDIERQYQLILGAAGEGIYGIAIDGKTTFLNPAAERMLGYKAHELIGKPMHDMIHHHRPDGREYPLCECPIYNAFQNRQINAVDDEVFWRKDGTSFEVEYVSTPIIDSEEVVGAVIVFRDVSSRRENENSLRDALLENAALRERLEMENAYLQEEILNRDNHHNLIGVSESLNTLIAQVELVAPTDASVLIGGESGTGKELVAHAIHQASSRAGRPLIRVNCAAIPPELFESEIFGHVKGSFSGALRDRIGRFELADGGTLFLDEVGELDIKLQAKLLRVVQEGQFERVGEEKSRQVDVRLIAATNRDLKMAVENDEFREDLYFRLNVFPIECVPLRQRASDIPVLAEHFLEKSIKKLNLPPLRLTKANVKTLMQYDWPGNIRELQNVIERAAIVSRNQRLTLDLPGGTRAISAATSSDEKLDDPETILDAKQMLAFEQQNLARALKACGGKVSGPKGAANLLGMKPTTVYSRIKQWDLK